MPGADLETDVLLAFPREQINLFESMVPLGLASIGAVLERAGYRVRIVDFSFYQGDFRRDLRRWKPSVVGIGGTTATRRGSFLTARLCKEILADVPVVYGGVHATFAAQDTLDHIPQVDYIVRGEGEYSFRGLCDFLTGRNGPDPAAIPGLSYRSGNAIVNIPGKRIDDLDLLPLPARHLFGHPYPMRLDFFGVDADCLITSRGCPARCTFCAASRMFPGGVRVRSMGAVRGELETILSRKKIGGLKLFDSTFTADRDHVHRFCDMIRDYRLLWECEIRADTVDRDLLRHMRSAGCRYINVGLETSSERLLAGMGKRISKDQVERALGWCQALDIKTKVFFTFGHPDETFQECRRDVDYIRQMRRMVDFCAVTVGMRVYPGTALERIALRRGFIPGDFSWVRGRPSLKNRLLLEFGDVVILRQSRLSFRHLVTIAALLVCQRTVTSGEYLRKILILNILRLVGGLSMHARYTMHRIRRVWNKWTSCLDPKLRRVPVRGE